MAKCDQFEAQKRTYEIARMIKRKPVKWVLAHYSKKWNVSESTIRNYISKAKREWTKWFNNLQNSGLGYHISQFRDIKDQAYNKYVVVEERNDKTGEITKRVVPMPDLKLIFDVAKEEAKLLNVYPAEKKDLKLSQSFADWLTEAKQSRNKPKGANEQTETSDEEDD
jgi:hypothetical protein